MRINRFFIERDFDEKKIRIDDKNLSWQLRKVLRLKKGKEILLFNHYQKEVLAKILNLEEDMVEVEIKKELKSRPEPLNYVILYCSLIKKENFEIVVQKAIEVGVKEIVPIIASRTVKLNFNRERLEKIIKESAEQSGRAYIPNLKDSLKFEKALIDAKDNLNLFFDESGLSFLEVFKEESSRSKKIGIFIGPEGGWSEQELKLAKENNFKIVNLGKFILRAETAAIVAGFLAVNCIK